MIQAGFSGKEYKQYCLWVLKFRHKLNKMIFFIGVVNFQNLNFVFNYIFMGMKFESISWNTKGPFEEMGC